MEADFFWAWGISAGVMVVLAALLGLKASVHPGILGVFIDRRGRFSLTHFQIVVWTIVVLSLVSGMFWGRLLQGGDLDPLGFSIPAEVLGLLGISLGSGLAAGVVKSSKDADAPQRIAADVPRPAQVFLLEEGALADKVIDVSKFQNFIITVILVIAFVIQAIDTIQAAKEVTDVVLPTFSPTFLTLLGISHAAYVGGKMPSQQGVPPEGLTVQSRLAGRVPPAG